MIKNHEKDPTNHGSHRKKLDQKVVKRVAASCDTTRPDGL